MTLLLDAATAELIRRAAAPVRERFRRSSAPLRDDWRPAWSGATLDQLRTELRAFAEQPGEWYPDEAIALAAIVIDEIGLAPAVRMATKEFPPDHVAELFKAYRRAWEHGDPDDDDATDPQQYLKRAAEFGAVEQARFAGMIEVYLEYAPHREYSPAKRDERRAEIDRMIQESFDENQQRREMGFNDEDVV